jgi:hypothetical protein
MILFIEILIMQHMYLGFCLTMLLKFFLTSYQTLHFYLLQLKLLITIHHNSEANNLIWMLWSRD